MADFETVLGRLQKAEGLERGPAIARLRELHEDGQVPEGAIPDLESNLVGQRAKSIGTLGGGGVIKGLTEIPYDILKHVPGMENITGARDEMLQNIQERVEPTKYAEGTGELVGGAAAYGAPFEALEEGIGIAGTKMGVPFLAGDGFLATSARRAISGGILGGASTGTIEGAKQWAKYGVILPPVIETSLNLLGGVGGVIGAKLSSLLARAGEDEPIDAEFRKVEPQKQLTGPPTIEGPIRSPTHQDFVAYPPKTRTYQTPIEPGSIDDIESFFESGKDKPTILGPVDRPSTTSSGETKPEAAFVRPQAEVPQLDEREIRAKIKSDIAIRMKNAKLKAKSASNAALAEAGVSQPEQGKVPLGSAGSIFNPVRRKSPDLPRVYVGTRDVQTGQPFEGTTTALLQSGNHGDVYVNASNPNTDLGKPQPVSLKNPAVLVVGHDTPYRDALAKLFPNNPALLESYDSHQEPDAFSRETLGRSLKKQGYDGLILKTDDISHDIIVDYKNYIAPQEKVGAIEPKDPPRSVFQRALKDEPIAKSIIEAQKQLPAPEFKEEGSVDLPAIVPEFDPNDLESINRAAQALGWEKASHLAIDIRASKFSPFEMLQHSAKGDVTPPPIHAIPGPEEGSVELAKYTPSGKNLKAAIRAITNRYPRIMMQLVSKFHVVHLPNMDWLGSTGVGPDNRIYIDINTAHLPDTPSGREQLHKFGYKDGEEKEFIATTIEHELTHAVQFWGDDRGLFKSLNIPHMAGIKTPEAGSKLTPEQWKEYSQQIPEAQAQRRDEALTQFFQKHRELRERVAQVPVELKEAVLRQHVGDVRAALKPMVVRRFNQLTGKNYTAVYAKKAKPDVADFENMDSFDGPSRSGPIDSQIDPDLYYSPELKSMLGAMQKAGMKWGGWFSKIRNAWDVSDNEDHLWFVSRVFQLARDMHVDKAKFNKRLGSILSEYGAEDKNYDNLWEAVEGLRRAPDGTLSQTVPNVDAKTAEAATKIREQVLDPAYEYVKGINRKAPAILKHFNLADTPDQWWRLKKLQTGLRAQVKNPSLDEFGAANQMSGMLNFDESHDLRGEYVDGYLTHQPIANERAELLNQIAQVDKIGQLTGVTDPTSQAIRQARVKRLAEIELELARGYVRSGPRTDVLPGKHYFGPMVVKDHPGAASVLVDKNIPQIAGRYVNGIVSKRYFDQVLHEFGKVAPTLPGSVRDYDVHYINNLRGLRGYKEDIGLSNFINDIQKKLEKVGIKQFNRVSINDVRRAGDFATQLQTFTKLLMTPVRFPAVQTTHLLMTTWPVAGTRATARGLGYFLSHPKQAVMEAMARGVVERDAEFLGAMDGVTPTTQGNLLKYSQTFSKYSDYFRKAVSWHTFRLQAMEPGFKPSGLAKTFIKDVPGRNRIAMSRDYADAMTDRTQFRLRAEGKPTAFVGGQVRRAITQFKPWMVNYGTLFKDVAKSGDAGMQARLLAALYFVGGPTAVLGGDLVYNEVRKELIKHFGYVLPNDTGFQQTANMLGWGSVIGDVDLLSLRSPIGLPSSKENVLPWLAGPTLGTLWDVASGIGDAKGDTGKEVKTVLSAISPEARALIDAGEEWRQGGVKSSMGEILAKRPTSSIVIRGLDLSPSVKSQRYNYRNDIVTALQSGHPEAARQLMKQAKTKGIIFGPKDMGQIRATVKHYLKGQKLYQRDPEAMLR